MKFHFYSGLALEPWDYRNVEEIGIGGSETSHVEMALRLAKRGHEVISYTRLPEDCPDTTYGGVQWRHVDEADFNEPGLWIIYRQPKLGQEVEPAEDRKYWLICQDVLYPKWTGVENFERVFGLCPIHCSEIQSRVPDGRVNLTSNGINVERIQAVEAQGIQRNPKRLMWASSPDRGLVECLNIFERAQERIDDLELHVFYGLNNIDYIRNSFDPDSQDRKAADSTTMQTRKACERAQQTTGVVWHGRVGQRELTQEWFKTGIWLYPTWFSETSCCVCLEAQACGAIPIVHPYWALKSNARHGIWVEGDPAEPLMKARYVEALVTVAGDPAAQEVVRAEMMPDIRQRYSWENWASQWEQLAEQDVRESVCC